MMLRNLHFLVILFVLITAATDLSGQTATFVNFAPSSPNAAFVKNQDIALRTDGGLYIADAGTRSVHSFDATGAPLEVIHSVTTASGILSFLNPQIICTDKNNTLYIYDEELVKVIVKPASGNGFAFGEKGSSLGQIDDVSDIAVDSEGYIYLLNGARKQVDIFSPAGDYISWIAGANNTFSNPIAIGLNGRNELYVLERDECSVFMYDVGGNLINTHRTMSRKSGVFVTKAIDMAVLSNGDFFILDAATGGITHFDKQAVVHGTTGAKGTGSKSVFENATAIATGFCYVNALAVLDAAVSRTQVFKVETKTSPMQPEAKRMRLVARSTARPAAADLAVAPSGMRYVIPFDNRAMVVAYKDTANYEAYAIRGKFDEAIAVTTDAQSNLYVVDGGNDEVVMFDSLGTLVRKFGQKIPKRLKDPTGIAIQENGNIIVADHSNGNFHLWNSSGDYQKIVIEAENSGILSPFKIQVDSKDQIFVWDNKANAIYRIASSGWPVALKQIKVRGMRSGDNPGEIGGFFVDPLDQIHVYNKTTSQLEVYAWDLEPVLKFSIGKPGYGTNSFEKVDNVLFDKITFMTYFAHEGGNGQHAYQFQLKPPTPENHFTFDVGDGGKLVVFFNKMNARSVLYHGLITNDQAGQDSLAAMTNTSSILLKESGGNNGLRHYGLVSLSYTNMSDPNIGFDNYLGYGDRALAEGAYDDALNAYKEALEKMGGSMKMKEYISSKLSEGGRILAAKQEAISSLNYLKLAYSLTPENPDTKDAYTKGFGAFFMQLAGREDYAEILNEAERMSATASLRPMVLSAVDSVSLAMGKMPNENAISNAITLQKKLVDWEPRNPEFYGSLAITNFELYKFKRNSALPAFEQEAALKEADRYGKQAVERLKQAKLPYNDMQLVLLQILNASAKHEEAEKMAFAEIGDSKMAADLTNKYRLQLADAYTGQGKYNLAVLEYQRMLLNDTENADLKIRMADALLAEKKYDEAKEVYQQLLIKDRSNAQYTARVGTIELMKGNYSEASFQLEKATKLDPTERSYYGPLAEAFEGAGNNQKAIDNYEVAVQYHAGKVEQMRNGFGSAKELTVATNQLNKYQIAFAKLNEQLGNFDEAVVAYKNVIASEPTNADAFYGLGKACISNGLVYDAAGAFSSACKLNPANDSYSAAYSSALKMRDKVSKNEPPLSILEIQVKEIYPSMYRNYSDVKLLPVGEVVVANNTSSPLTPSSITVFVKELMTQPTQMVSAPMVGYSNTYIQLSALFTDKILSYTADEKLQLDVVIKYMDGGQEKSVTKSATFVLHGRNAITWKDKRCLASFISPSEEALIEYNKKADQIFKGERTYGLNKPILKAMQIYTLLHNSNFVYSPDPVLSFATVSTNTDILDYLQYPSETLKRRSGDCDDLVALYASMLENAGIATAYIDVPGHVFIAFDSEVKPADIVAAGLSAMETIVHQGKVWIPVETTLLGTNNFMNAWKSGAERYFNELTQGNFPELVSLADARTVYVPSNYVPAGFDEKPMAGKDMMLEYTNMLAQLTAKTKKEVVAEIANRYQTEPENIFIKNKYATLLGQIGELTKAEKVLLEAFEIAPSNPSVLNNLGNLYFLKNDSGKALEFYTQASACDPADAEILVNICKAHLLAGNNAQAKVWFDKAIALNTNLEVLYSNLKSQIK